MKNGFCPLASGSKGNCLFFSYGETKILVDAGLSGRATMKKLAEIDVDLDEIQAILITHEHSDHIAGLRALALKRQIPVIANVETAKAIARHLGECPEFQIFTTGERFTFKELDITPFSIQHDGADPVAFKIEAGKAKVGICTDLGFASTLVKRHLKGCDFLHLEANHEPHMVHACSRPLVYKQRVLSRSGHLSNEACGDLLKEIIDEGLKHVHLAHLSQECNHPETALKAIKAKLEEVGREALTIAIAHQDRVSHAVHF
jgi:phosphoribosyl 1,2-cyclic phosphodiesterase